MDVSKIDFSKVEGITDARTIHGNPEHLIEQVNKGFILATNDEDYKSLMKAFFEYSFDNK